MMPLRMLCRLSSNFWARTSSPMTLAASCEHIQYSLDATPVHAVTTSATFNAHELILSARDFARYTSLSAQFRSGRTDWRWLRPWLCVCVCMWVLTMPERETQAAPATGP